MIFNELIKNKTYYINISNLNFIQNASLNEIMGLGIFKWIVKNTFFKYLNQKLKLKNKVQTSELNELRKEMTYSEISHLVGFGFVTIIAFFNTFSNNYLFGFTLMIINIILNLYPSLLQQENKRRIDKLIKKEIKTVANNV